MGNWEEEVWEGLGKKDIIVRYPSVNSSGIWGGNLGTEGEGRGGKVT